MGMAEKPKHKSDRVETFLEGGLRDGWLDSFSFSGQTLDQLKELGLSEDLISDLKDVAAEFIYLREKEGVKLAPSEIRRALERCEKEVKSLLKSLKGLDSPTKDFLREQSYFHARDPGFVRRLEGDLSKLVSHVLLPAQMKRESKSKQPGKRKKRSKIAQRVLARDIAFIIQKHGKKATMHKNSHWTKTLGIILADAREAKKEPFNIIRAVWPNIKDRLRGTSP